ncbi:hypothetical protein QTN25_009539 [Entamoeba marina]
MSTLKLIWNFDLKDLHIYRIILGLLNGISNLFENSIPHPHLHPGNVLLNDTYDKVIITDAFPAMKYWFGQQTEQTILLQNFGFNDEYIRSTHKKNMWFVVETLFHFVTHNDLFDITVIPIESIFYSSLTEWADPNYPLDCYSMINSLKSIQKNIFPTPELQPTQQPNFS